MVDIFVSNINPRKIHQEPIPKEFIAILAVESELGGSGGGSPICLEKNVLEDFMKLLVISAEIKL